MLPRSSIRPSACPAGLRSAASRPAESALAHARSLDRALAGAALACLLAALAGCTEEQAAPGPALSIQRLIELSTDLDPTLTSDYHDRHFLAGEAYLAEMRQAPHELGLEALQTFKEFAAGPERKPDKVMRNLLDVAAHAATEETVPLLETLTLEYGHDISDRTEGMLLLGEVAPKRAVEILTPLLKKTKQTSTMPNDEFILKAYIDACNRSGTDPVPILVDVASNIYKQDYARTLAIKELGNHQDLLAQQTLRFLLVESTGNSYLRIKTAQAILKSFPREQACAIFEEVSQKEADDNFLLFLADIIQDNCE